MRSCSRCATASENGILPGSHDVVSCSFHNGRLEVLGTKSREAKCSAHRTPPRAKQGGVNVCGKEPKMPAGHRCKNDRVPGLAVVGVERFDVVPSVGRLWTRDVKTSGGHE